jgi:hypothetical protein
MCRQSSVMKKFMNHARCWRNKKVNYESDETRRGSRRVAATSTDGRHRGTEGRNKRGFLVGASLRTSTSRPSSFRLLPHPLHLAVYTTASDSWALVNASAGKLRSQSAAGDAPARHSTCRPDAELNSFRADHTPHDLTYPAPSYINWAKRRHGTPWRSHTISSSSSLRRRAARALHPGRRQARA